jgi:hypothetical protein
MSQHLRKINRFISWQFHARTFLWLAESVLLSLAASESLAGSTLLPAVRCARICLTALTRAAIGIRQERTMQCGLYE